jgi:GT2 family glycosyltransferase
MPVSIFYPPDPVKHAQHNTGYIMVAVTTCCNSWNMTSDLLASLAATDDPIHVVVFDDNSKDGTAEKAAALGFPMFTTARMTGNTMNMNRAWKYFTSYEGLQSLFIMNNDISVAAGTFVKLHRCQLEAPVSGKCLFRRVSGVVCNVHCL